MSLLVILTTLATTLIILNMNYGESMKRKMSKKNTILNHWGKHKPTKEDLDKLKVEEMEEEDIYEQ